MQTNSSNGIGTKFLLASAALIVIFAGLKAAQDILAPFFLAVFFATVLLPPLRWLKNRGLSDITAILVLSGVVFLLGLGFVWIFSTSLTHFAAKIPVYQEKVTGGLAAADNWINDTLDRFDAVEKTIPHWGNPEELTAVPQNNEAIEKADTEEKVKFSLRNIVQVDTLVGYVQIGVKELLNTAAVSSLVAVLVIFLLIEAAHLPNKVTEAFGGRDLSNEYFERIAADTWNYMKIKTGVNILTGAATGTGLWFLGVEYALLWGILMFFLNYIPNIGQIIASVPPVLLALMDQGTTSAVIVTLWLAAVNTAAGYGLEPRYLEAGLGISGLVVLLSLIFWGWLLGPAGMFLSAPLTMVVKIVLQNDPKTRWIAVMLGNR
ncbi:MAG: AI-2E family transporter [Planctomycetaceae bacterium]|jgi:predicted PurR-regulated permease PerM|nr:AI-2E family transporter [Planctomycetaceae bacterium]